MKKLWDLAQESLVHIQGSYGILDQYLWMSAKYGNISVYKLKNYIFSRIFQSLNAT
jgi:hypothetical protein